MEITQFTYSQQVGVACDPVSAELTHGLERLAMYLQDVDNVYDLVWAPGVSCGEVRDEVEMVDLNFELADVAFHRELFERYEAESKRMVEAGVRTYDYRMKHHTFNILDARGAISVAERQQTIFRVRALQKHAQRHIVQREEMGFLRQTRG